jgi:hypothetical protein
MKQPKRRSGKTIFVRNKSSSVKGVRERIVFNLRTDKALVRNEILEGREYLVVPMVMLTEGVHRGSNGAMLYPADELGKTPCVWNMKPLVVNHPENNGEGLSACDPVVAEKYKVGLIMNTEFDDRNRLKAEAWLEVERANKVDPRIMAAVENQRMMELSTGVFVDKDFVEGEFNGKHYDAIARNYRPDHLALLPDKKGACSIDDGAGFIRNQAEDNPELVEVLMTYNAKKPAPSKDEPAGDPAHEASKMANRKGAWAVISGKKSAHDTAAQAHEKAARLYTKAGNKPFADWHNQKASDHKNWGDEAEDSAADKPTDNEFEDGNGGTDAGANDDTGEPTGSVPTKATPTSIATERSNTAMLSGSAKAHKSAALSHRTAATAIRKSNKGKDTTMSKYHDSAAKMHDCVGATCNKEVAAKLTSRTENATSHSDLHSSLSKQLRSKTDTSMGYVTDVYDDHFIYDDGKGNLCKQGYCVGDGEEPEFEGEPKAVVRKTSYKPAANSEAQRGTHNNMNKKQLIEALITNHGWEESDRKFLSGLPEERLLVLHQSAEALAKNTRSAKDHANVSDPDEDPDAEDNQDDDRGDDNGGTSSETVKKGGGKATVGKTDNSSKAKRKLALNEFLETAPDEVKEMIQESKRIVDNERTQLIEAITANDASQFTEAELKEMKMPQLRKIAAIAGVGSTENVMDQATRRPLYTGQGDVAQVRNEEGEEVTTNAGDDTLVAPVMNFERTS